MFKQIMSSDIYWRSVIRLGLLFIVVWSIIVHLREYGFDFSGFKTNIIDNGLFFRYVRSRIVGGLIYGMIAAFIFQRRKIIENRRNNKLQ